MAAPSRSLLSLLVCSLLLISFARSTIAGRQAPAAAAAASTAGKKQTEDLADDAAGLIRGVRNAIGRGLPSLSRGGLGNLGDLDHSGPAAANAKYLPGADDTLVPNPGYEVPNPFRGGSGSP